MHSILESHKPLAMLLSMNRIKKYFEDSQLNQDLYEEVCTAAWQGMLDHTLDVWFGSIESHPNEEDFFFKSFDSRLN